MYATYSHHSNSDNNNNNRKSDENALRNHGTTTAVTVTTVSVPPSWPAGQLIEQGSEIDVLSGEINFEKMYYKLLLDTYPSDEEITHMDVQNMDHNSTAAIVTAVSGVRPTAAAVDVGLVDFIAKLKVSNSYTIIL